MSLDLIGKTTYLPCEICGKTSFVDILNKGKIGKTGEYGPLSIQQCDNCGHVMANPRFDKQYYIDYYTSHYKDNVEYLGDGAPSSDLVARQQKRGELCMKYITSTVGLQPGSLLDLGCAYGATMIPFLRENWSVQGIDPEMASVDYGNNTLNLPIDYGFAENMPYKDNTFDLVISLGALEHVHDFDSSMSEVNRILKNGAYLFIRMRHNRPWGLIWEYYNKNHYRFFCGNTHKLALIKYGFEIVDYTNRTIEGRLGDRYIIARKTSEPSEYLMQKALDSGLKDSSTELLSYLHSHYSFAESRARKLLGYLSEIDNDIEILAEHIQNGQFDYPLLNAYTSHLEAVQRAVKEANVILSLNGDHGIRSL